jgi:cytoskeletal protein CcmA (bactofilin family)
MNTERKTIIQKDTIVKGEIRNCQSIDIYGYIEGKLAAENVLIHPDGTFYGMLKTDSADVQGTLQGDVFVNQLINIRASGSVNGNIQYGQLAMEMGADLSAELRNVPPRIAGDLDLTVGRGQVVGVTTEDITAIDPDDHAVNLVYTISNLVNGYMAFAKARKTPITEFTQDDIETNKIVFVHDGSPTDTAGFDFVVSDASGATSGKPQSVNVTVKTRQKMAS